MKLEDLKAGLYNYNLSLLGYSLILDKEDYITHHYYIKTHGEIYEIKYELSINKVTCNLAEHKPLKEVLKEQDAQSEYYLCSDKNLKLITLNEFMCDNTNEDFISMFEIMEGSLENYPIELLTDKLLIVDNKNASSSLGRIYLKKDAVKSERVSKEKFYSMIF